jgi:uncharacterized protein YaiI (UPF0178 family)
MKILVDADACPVREIVVRMAKRRNISLVMVIDTSHELSADYGEVITVDKGADSADYAIAGLTSRGDIVVTQDYGLAAMMLAKGARAINQDGMIYTDDNIDELLARRYVGQKIRRSGGRTKGPKKRAKKDDSHFERSFEMMLGK